MAALVALATVSNVVVVVMVVVVLISTVLHVYFKSPSVTPTFELL